MEFVVTGFSLQIHLQHTGAISQENVFADYEFGNKHVPGLCIAFNCLSDYRCVFTTL
jgi:hypothetical protein